MSTIFAVATPPGKSGVAIIRVSGEKAQQALDCFGVSKNLEPRKAKLCKLYLPTKYQLNGFKILDEALVLYFPGPNSFTGEDLIELHLHGSKAIIGLALQVLSEQPGFRMAEPGEYTKRAFFSGKMDLTKIDGLIDVINSDTTFQLCQAMRQMQGELEALYEGWRKELINILCHVEAHIDFPDEDLPETLVDIAQKTVDNLIIAIDKHIDDNKRGIRIREGVYVAILGSPNAGKSTLLNYLAQRDVAITSNIAGTTRDIIEVNLDLGGVAVTIADTAGIRNTNDEIEKIGVDKAIKNAKLADVKIVIFDATLPIEEDILKLIDEQTLVVANKIDLVEASEGFVEQCMQVSLSKNIGLNELLEELTNRVQAMVGVSSDPVITRERYRGYLVRCLEALKTFNLDLPIEIAAEELRYAADSIGKITGKIDVEEVLDEIFRNFCIGK